MTFQHRNLFDRIDGKSRKAKNYEFMNRKICT